jgi:hypothetical protein
MESQSAPYKVSASSDYKLFKFISLIIAFDVAVVGIVQYLFFTHTYTNTLGTGMLPPIPEYILSGVLLFFLAIAITFTLFSNRWFAEENHVI